MALTKEDLKDISLAVATGVVEAMKSAAPSLAERERAEISELTGGRQTDVARVFNLVCEYEFSGRSIAIQNGVDLPEMMIPVSVLVQEANGRWRQINCHCPDDSRPRAFLVAHFRQQRADAIREAELSQDPTRIARVESQIAEDVTRAIAFSFTLPLSKALVGAAKYLGDDRRLKVLSSAEGEGPFAPLLPCRVMKREAPAILHAPSPPSVTETSTEPVADAISSPLDPRLAARTGTQQPASSDDWADGTGGPARSGKPSDAGDAFMPPAASGAR